MGKQHESKRKQSLVAGWLLRREMSFLSDI